ncbi:MAG: hypothetical protein COS68_03280 [Elusimicrobia bacterium CG06_land_8_20_14_3_00_38_11]|nr:MAG: hypothetical protein COS68_03280 [Elusimicrobia bacterium CG06_land_8_20_14_3_00_38_11]
MGQVFTFLIAVTGGDEKMALTETTKREFAKRTLDILNSNADALKKAGVDSSVKSGELKQLIDDAFSAEEKQLAAQTQSKKATEASQNATTEAYKKASAVIELLVGSLGKEDALSKRLRNLRDEIANEALRGKSEAT